MWLTPWWYIRSWLRAIKCVRKVCFYFALFKKNFAGSYFKMSTSFHCKILLDELLQLGGKLGGWRHCAACNKIREKMLNFSSCEHRMCSPCLGSASIKMPCPSCGKVSTLKESSKQFVNSLLVLNKTIEQAQPIIEEAQQTHSRQMPESTAVTTCRRGKKTTSKCVDKRNAQGETKLQQACIAKDTEKVKMLIAAGADVNAQDNIGWTSLHEAAIYGCYEIARSLLEAGALVDVPGEMNITPLYDAVTNDKIEVAKLLLDNGANVNARTLHGTLPIDVAISDEMKALLVEKSASQVMPPETKMRKFSETAVWDASSMVLLCIDKDKKLLEDQLKPFIQQFKLKLSKTYTDKVTHVVVLTEDGVCSVSFEVLQALVEGKTIISSEWITKCLEADKLLDSLPFEVKGTRKFPSSFAPERARNNGVLKSPRLFNGCNVFLRHKTGKYTADDLVLSKEKFAQLIKLGDGKVLTREPKPGAITEMNGTIPFHAAADGPLSKCSDYIIYWKGDEGIKYNMQHIKALPVNWLVTCMETFELLDTTDIQSYLST